LSGPVAFHSLIIECYQLLQYNLLWDPRKCEFGGDRL